MSSLFIYWKVPSAQAHAALGAARGWQQTLRDQHPALQAALYRRREPGSERVTLMETYAAPAGVSNAVAAEIEALAGQSLLALGAPARHVEVFDAIAD